MVDSSTSPKVTNSKDFVSQQVQSHLILGPLSRGNKTGIFIIVGMVFLLVLRLLLSNLNVGAILNLGITAVMLIFAAKSLLKTPFDQQARWLWWLSKILGIVLSSVFLLCSLIQLLEKKRDGWLFLSVGSIWMPGPEFIPKIAPHQKYVTILRLVFTGLSFYVAAKAGILD